MVLGSVPYLNAVPLTWALNKIGFCGTLVFGAPAQLSVWLEQGKIDAGWLEKVEAIDNIFPNINYKVYRPL